MKIECTVEELKELLEKSTSAAATTDVDNLKSIDILLCDKKVN